MTREEFDRLRLGDVVKSRRGEWKVVDIDRDESPQVMASNNHYSGWIDFQEIDVVEPTPKETPGGTGMDYDKLLAGGFSKLDRITHTVYFIQTSSFGPSTQIEVVVVADRYLVQLVDYDRDHVCTFQGIDTIEDMAALLYMFKVYHELDCADSPQEGE